MFLRVPALVFTSLLFYIPGFQALYYKIYDLSIIYLVCGTVSAYYWADPSANPRALLLDKICANINLAYSFYRGYNTVGENVEDIIQVAYLFLVTVFCYIFACWNYQCNPESDVWICYHAFFHVNCTILKGQGLMQGTKVPSRSLLPEQGTKVPSRSLLPV